MEEAQVRFGAITSADVKLWLTGRNEENYERNPVYLHSAILEKSEFFKVKMSERWSWGKSTEIRVTTCHNFDDYLKCIELMYGERVYLSNVEECLAILSVASELLFHDCMSQCMQYLEAVRWSAEQESQIRNVLSSLGLKLLPDLAARLDKEDDYHILFVDKMINQMVCLIEGQQVTVRNRETAEKYIAGILEGNTCRDVVKVCERVLLHEFKSSIRFRHISIMRTLFRLIEQCDRQILKAAFIAFCEDPELRNDVEFCADMFYIILCFMQAIGDGKIIISRASRISFLTTWLPTMGEFCCEILPKLGELDKAALNVIECLPLVDRKRICVEWLEIYMEYDIDITTPISLFKDLQDAHYKSTSK